MLVLAATASLLAVPSGTRGLPSVVAPRTAAAAAPPKRPEAKRVEEPMPQRPTPPSAPGVPSERDHDVLSDGPAIRSVSAWPNDTPASFAVDGRDDTAWIGGAGGPWDYRIVFRAGVHLSLLRARFGDGPTQGVPAVFHWEVSPGRDGAACVSSPLDSSFVPVPDTADQVLDVGAASPTRRSWFVSVDACALRLVIDRTNGGPPVLRELSAIAGARDLLRDAMVMPGANGADPRGAIDGRYDVPFVGQPGAAEWQLALRLPRATTIDRVRLVLGEDATTSPRLLGTTPKKPAPAGRTYGIARAPVRYRVETSADGVTFTPVAIEPRTIGYGAFPNDSVVPLRRRLVTFPAREVRAIRLVMIGATGEDGVPDPQASPVVRAIEAYAAADARPLLPAPFILSVNANPSGESHDRVGGELANDVYWAKFLQRRFAAVLPALRKDDRYARALGPTGALLEAPRDPFSGAALEAIEGDDATLDLPLLEGSSPRPIVVLSGSNSWDYARLSGPDRKDDSRWRWDPLRDAHSGGIGQLVHAVQRRSAPFLGFCGGAQILALLEARAGAQKLHPGAWFSAWDDAAIIDATLRRTTGRPIRGFADAAALFRSWPGDGRPREPVRFIPGNDLFLDVAGLGHRTVTRAFPKSHTDVVRPSAFLPGAPLEAFEVLATSTFCSPAVVSAGPNDAAFTNPNGPGRCIQVPEVFRSKDDGFPIIGAQFHAEQYDFNVPAAEDPPESVADPRLFIAAEYESIVDAYLSLATRTTLSAP